MQGLYVPFCFFIWYALNVAYNITNKWALEGVHKFVTDNTQHSSALPFTIACLQFGVGSCYACSVWILGYRRPIPHTNELSTIIMFIKKLCWKIIKTTKLDRLLPHHYSEINTTSQNSNREHTQNSLPINKIFRIGIYHTLGQICTVIALSANSIGFAHIIKAAEPFFSALVSRILLNQKMDIRVYLSLIPVVGGVCLACASSTEFTWISFCAGMCSNFLFAMRAVVSKQAMEGKTTTAKQSKNFKSKTSLVMEDEESSLEHNDVGEKEHTTPSKISATNLFAAVTCISFIISIPLTVMIEGNILWDIINLNAKEKEDPNKEQSDRATLYILISGLFHYLNNEVMYLVLSNVHPVTLAVGNTMKRVFIIVAGVIVFSTPVSGLAAIGSTIGIGGVLLYSLMKQWYGISQTRTISIKPQLTP